MFRKVFVLLIIINLILSNFALSGESRYAQSLSRMEREWFHRDFNGEDDEIRLARLEERVFGTIHGVDKQKRYSQLVQAFNLRKTRQSCRSSAPRNWLYGVPTSLPMNVNDLLGVGK
jgi:hypothetical protein